MQNLKCLVVGEGDVGKTCLVIRYTTKAFPGEFIPAVYEPFPASVTVNGEPTTLVVCDTAGRVGFEQSREMSYPKTNVVLLCFSINNKTSFDNIKSRWHPEVSRFCPGVPIILVGTKQDLREDSENNTDLVTTEQTEQMTQDIGATKYVECSGLKDTGLEELFSEAVSAAVLYKATAPEPKNESSKACCTLL